MHDTVDKLPPQKSQSKKLPAIQFYPGDWKRDPCVQSLGFHDRGVWLEMLFLMHESDERGVLILNGKPMSDQALANCIGLDKQILTTTLTTILENGVASRRADGAIFNRRMVRDEEIRQERIKAGHMGGNPILLKQNPTTPDKQNPTPSSSSSSSSSDLKKEEDPSGSSSLPKTNQLEKITLAPRILMTKEQARKMVDEFGKEACEYYKPVCSDWLVANGKTKKDGAAFMRNWMKKERSERKGFYYPKNNFNSHTQILAPGLRNQAASVAAVQNILKECEENET